MTGPPPAGARLPRLAAGPRRAVLAGIALAGIVFVGSALGSALLVGTLVGGGGGPEVVAALVAVAGVLGAAAYTERVLGERLAQSWVHDIRMLLVAGSLRPHPGEPSLGVTVARTTNDLAALRTWVAQGLVPAGILGLLVPGCLVGLAVLDPRLAAGAAAVLAGAAAVGVPLTRRAYTTARRLRRRRGGLAALVADTVRARDTVVRGGGADRELGRIGRRSRAVVRAAQDRAGAAGSLRAVTAGASAVLTVVVVVVGRAVGGAAAPATVASALVLIGVLAAPLAQAGRLVELRENARAARHVLVPALAAAAPAGQATAAPAGQAAAPAGGDAADAPPRCPAPPGEVRVGATGADGTWRAGPGERIRVVGPGAGALLRALPAPGAGDPQVRVDGWDLAAVPARQRRSLVGSAGAGDVLERGPLRRALRYRCPGLDADATTAVLDRVGLRAAVAALPDGDRTRLHSGGAPLDPADRARLLLGRAVAGAPPLLVLDRIDDLLDDDGRAVLRRLVDEHPGVVVFASDLPERVCAGWTERSVAGAATVDDLPAEQARTGPADGGPAGGAPHGRTRLLTAGLAALSVGLAGATVALSGTGPVGAAAPPAVPGDVRPAASAGTAPPDAGATAGQPAPGAPRPDAGAAPGAAPRSGPAAPAAAVAPPAGGPLGPPAAPPGSPAAPPTGPDAPTAPPVGAPGGTDVGPDASDDDSDDGPDDSDDGSDDSDDGPDDQDDGDD